jgi:hypothetical protein
MQIYFINSKFYENVKNQILKFPLKKLGQLPKIKNRKKPQNPLTFYVMIFYIKKTVKKISKT